MHWNKTTWENIFLSDLRKLTCRTAKACLRAKIFSVLRTLYNFVLLSNITQENKKTTSTHTDIIAKCRSIDVQKKKMIDDIIYM